MMRLRCELWTIVLIGVGFCATPLRAEPAAASPVEVAAAIDRHFDRFWVSAVVEPVPESDDATFLRRVTLDLIGRIPTASEVREFLADRSPLKRRDAIVRLVQSPAYARHFASVWRRTWLPQTEVAPHNYLGEELEQWLTVQLQQRTPYDRIVRELLSVAAPASDRGARENPRGRTPVTFLLANDMRPEELAANATRELLGVNLECAQCHNHPFASWKQEEFWQTAAFFAGSASEDAPPKIQIPESDKTVVARLWTGEDLDWPAECDAATGRRVFAAWVTGSQNKLFARNVVNRLWATLLGAGLHQPIDDLAHTDQSPHAELLDELAKEFADSDFDLAHLTESILLSRAYQLSARHLPDDRLPVAQSDFSAAAVRGLSGEQLYDSLRIATGRRLLQADLDPADALLERRRFADAFQVTHPDKPQRSVLQALALMNGALTDRLNDPTDSPLLAVAADGPFLDNRGRVELLYLTVLSRLPTREESDELCKYLATAEEKGDSRRALADICWAMLNSVEFNTNH